jgi:micrococcal nuclease
VVVAIGVAGCAPAGSPAATATTVPDDLVRYAATVLDVPDGDSLVVRIEDGVEERLRLVGINAPEADECLGDAARDALERRVGDSVVLAIETESRDQFDRLLAHVFADDLYVNGAQVADGLAIALSVDSTLRADLLNAEKRAAVARIGMWAVGACGGGLPPPFRIEDVVFDPPGPDEQGLDRELVVVGNGSGDTYFDLGGFVLRDESTANRFVFPAGTTLEPGGRVTVASGCDPPPSALSWCSDQPIWNNSGDLALLLTPEGEVVHHYRYTDPDS